MVKQKIGKKILSLATAFCLAASVFSVPVVANAVTTENVTSQAEDYGLVDNVQQGQILQCWNWSFSGIKNNMQKIAEQGFSAIQTSPIQPIKESTQGRSFNSGWWVYYQPAKFCIETSSQNAQGTKADFEAMCAEAHKYGIKVIVDAVLNHMANNGNNTVSSIIQDDIKNDPDCWHSITTNTSNWSNRWDITHNCMAGLPDLNTGNSKIQNYEKAFMKECVDAGADGFRFDGAKHIELPNDLHNASSNFWSELLGYTTSYAQSTRGITPYYYGEVLDNTGGGQTIVDEYTRYMSITVNASSNDIRNQVNNGNASGAKRSDISFNDGSSPAPNKAVIWNESHDTYADGSSRGQSDSTLNKTWALVGARAEAVGMYLARPASYEQNIGIASLTAWANKEVQAVNRFNNYFVGQTEYLSSSGSIAYNERGTSGVVLVNCSGTSTSVSVKANKMADGTYTDQVTGNTFTVSGGQIKGQIGSTGIAVVYNAVTKPSISVSKASGTYRVDKASGISVDLTLTNATSGTYSINGGTAQTFTGNKTILVGEGVDYGVDIKLTVTATDGTTTSEPKTYTYKKADPSAAQMIYFDNSSYNWSSVYCYIYSDGSVIDPTEPTTTTEPITSTDPSEPDGTIKFTDSLSWGKVNAYFFNDNGTCGEAWPGTAMTKYETNFEGKGNYTIEIPSGATSVIFNNGNVQTVNLALSGVTGYYLDGTQTNGKYNGVAWNASELVASSARVTDIVASGAATVQENAAWPGVKMTLDSATGYYVAEVPIGFENGKVIFTESKDSTTNRYPADGEDGLSLNGNSMLFSAGNSWTVYSKVDPTDPTEPTTAPTDPTQPTVTILLGDVTEDGRVNLSDAIALQKVSIALGALTAKQKAEGDVDGNGKVNLADAVLVQKYTLQLNVSYPIGEEKEVVLN
ncbi:MAG: starch-binding protein [Acutalibacteraceae bacterium]